MEVLGGDVVLGLVEAAGAAGEDADTDGHFSGTSSDIGNGSSKSEEEEDVIEEYVRQIRNNYKAVDIIDLNKFASEKWDDFELSGSETDAECEAIVNADIATVFDALTENVVVKKIYLGFQMSNGIECKITRVGAEAISRALAKNKTICDLEIAGRTFSDDGSLNTVLRGLRENNNTKIETLTISGYEAEEIFEGEGPEAILPLDGIRILANILSENTSIRELRLVSNACAWTQNCCAVLCSGLRANTSVKMLDFLYNQWLDEEEMEVICQEVAGKAKVKYWSNASAKLPHFIFNNRNIEEIRITFMTFDTLDEDYWESLTAAFRKNDAIKTAIFTYNERTTRQGKFDPRLVNLVEGLVKGSVEKLSFRNMNVGDRGVAHVCQTLCRSSTIRELKLIDCGNRDHQITAVGAEALASLLRESKTLEKLKLDCIVSEPQYFIGNQGAIAIASAIINRKAKTKTLMLDTCNIGDTGAIVLCGLLDLPKVGMEALCLNGNPFGVSVCSAFAKALRKNNRLEVLELGCPRKGETTAAETILHLLFLNSLEVNSVLRRLVLPYAPGAHTMEEGLKKRHALCRLSQTNHTIIGISALGNNHNFFDDNMRIPNKKHPLLASTMKDAPFPANFIKDISGAILANAFVRTESIAGLDGVFRLLRQVGAEATRFANSKKRSRET